MTGDRLLVVDDDVTGAGLIGEILRRAGYVVEIATSGQGALASVAANSPALMILDYQLPDLEGPELLDLLRAGGPRPPFPVLVLTGARLSAADQVLTIDRGATDHLAKGVDRQVLLAKVRSALRSGRSGSEVRRGRLRIEDGRAWLDGRPLGLERRPLAVLHALAIREGTVGRDELLGEVWGTGFRGFDHAVEQAVYQIRRALGDPGWIVTVRGRGYRFVTRA